MDRVMIVTGGSRGIGAATARLAARDGHDVCINYLSAREAAESVATAVRAAGRRALIVQGDMARAVFYTATTRATEQLHVLAEAHLASEMSDLADRFSPGRAEQ